MVENISSILDDYSVGNTSRREFLSRVGGTAALASLLPLLTTSNKAIAQPMPPVYGLDERDRRWKNVREMMSRLGLDCLIVPHSSEMGYGHLEYANYLSNGVFSSHSGAIIFPLEGDPVTVGHRPRHPDSPPGWIPGFVHKFSESGQIPIADHIIREMNERGFASSTVGILGTRANAEGANEFSNEGFISYATWSAILASLPEAKFEDITLQFGELMSIKGEQEIEQFETAALVGEDLHRILVDRVKIGMSDIEFRAIVAEHLVLNRARADVQALFLGPGIISDGQVINSEYGIIHGGGYTQVTLCQAMGEVSSTTEELYKVARASLEYGMENLKPGITFGELAEGMEDVVLSAGKWHWFPQVHSLRPMLMVAPIYDLAPPFPASKTIGADIVIKENMIFSFEPGAKTGSGINTPEVKLGGSCVVTADGNRMFNQIGQELQRIG